MGKVGKFIAIGAAALALSGCPTEVKPNPDNPGYDPNKKLTSEQIRAIAFDLDEVGRANLITVNRDSMMVAVYEGREAYDEENYNMNRELVEFNSFGSVSARNPIERIMYDMNLLFSGPYYQLSYQYFDRPGYVAPEVMEMFERVHNVIQFIVNDLDTDNLEQSAQELNRLLKACQDYLPKIRTYLQNTGGNLHPDTLKLIKSRLDSFENRTIPNIRALTQFLTLAKQEGQSFSTVPCKYPEFADSYTFDGAIQTGYNEVLLAKTVIGNAYEQFMEKLAEQQAQIQQANTARSQRKALDAVVER